MTPPLQKKTKTKETPPKNHHNALEKYEIIFHHLYTFGYFAHDLASFSHNLCK